MRAALDQLTDELVGEAIAEGRFESRQAHAVDALVLLCQRYLDAYEDMTSPPLGDAAPTNPAKTEQDAPADTSPTGPSAPPSPAAETGDESRDPDSPVPRLSPSPSAAGRRKRRRNRGRAARYLGIIRIDLGELQSGDAAPGTGPFVEIAGVGPVPLDVAERLLGNSILKLVITKGVDVLNVTHLGRGPSAAQEVALLWSQPSCTVTPCPVPVYEWDHNEPWVESRVTELVNLKGYCKHHHYLKTFKGWALIDDGASHLLVPPDDPRHPSSTSGPPANGPP